MNTAAASFGGCVAVVTAAASEKCEPSASVSAGRRKSIAAAAATRRLSIFDINRTSATGNEEINRPRGNFVA